ncbi:MAG: oligopeptide transporter, OPT family [Stygiobacter sp. RIFOXYC12_FULL_38_8]|nr:MAG: oligopeptide transporter, OPT family [Stygiobacter sp. RIFOXYA12_FULL_38_9]OGV08662.1 MAG: oligopeptide transporter, OPT family [Stygiobacter sp. RIFOXYB2_FULL_37_11]OGV13450.1 MAG: oligopeptide transporter, OPT family [Stygiobacter sp. RIFOXYA2_FULL_38_8]OGV14740.1 MAG: oligopeptide transporter, OPT family [Stygiobacter sp. RIFOXYC2_FULL_38_25]OGV22276.1 MAG: oligopeptide transporter, OPT family [Stygiobacter sp. RIFOXYC12_FULL_38_8]OGV79233.1 MAG: oligopeptide transporter, OPT family
MSSHETPASSGLPSNAYTELKPGEQYVPIMSPAKIYPEVNTYSVVTGILMAVVFSAAAAYLGLKVGQVFEAAIPIAILAVGLTNLLKKKDGLGQNVIIQSIGSSSGAVVAGAIFTLPGIYILNLQATFFQMFFASLLGGFLGILFLIPFRKYFVSEMHGKLPFPEGTATTEILVAGEKGGNHALILVISGLIGGVYDFLVATFGTWAEIFTSRVIGVGEVLADKFKIVFRLNTSAAVVGLGYVIGLKYSVIIVAGSFLSYFVFVPLIAYFGDSLTVTIGSGVTLLVKDMSAELIFRNYVRHIGIGAIAMAGFIGIVRSSGVIKSAISLAFNEIAGKKESTTSEEVRTQKDLSMKIIVIGIIVTAIILFVFFLFGVVFNVLHAIVGLLIVMIMSFLFTTVAANAIAITGNNPVSGMTLMTLVLSSIILVSVGLSGPTGMVSALIIGGVVCTALSVAGSFVTDLKIGYWLGSTPQKQEKWKFVGAFVSAATVVWIISLLDKIYGFAGGGLPAPQANAMAAIIQPLMSNQPAPWMLYIAGACIALILAMIKVPVLAFALGMYLPQEINTPLLVGGLISHYVSTRSKDEELNNARRERGTLIASGFIAGGALMGVVSVIIRSTGANWVMAEWAESHSAEILSFVMFCLLCLYTIWDSLRAKKED